MNFYSEFGEDVAIWNHDPEFFRVPRYYVDVGAGHPTLHSNTAFLRELGWRGLHIDGNQGWEKDWPAGSFIHAIISTQSSVHFTANPCKELSRIGDAPPNADAFPLELFLKEKHVDKIGLMSIDCEGHEFEVLRSMDLERHEPRFIISEFNTQGIGEDYRVMEYLIERGYSVIHQTLANLIYEAGQQ